eukprot:2360123-Prymnesium_polylepis.1
MLALASTSLSYTAPALPSRVGLRAGVVRAQNEMEPDEGWNVDNLMTMMDDSEEAVGGPKVAEVFDRPVFDVKELPGATAPLGFWDPAGFSEGASEGKGAPKPARRRRARAAVELIARRAGWSRRPRLLICVRMCR